MKEQLVNKVLFSMQEVLSEEQLRELKGVLQGVLCLYKVESEKQELRVIDDSWQDDLEDYLMAKALEGKSVETLFTYIIFVLYQLLVHLNVCV